MSASRSTGGRRRSSPWRSPAARRRSTPSACRLRARAGDPRTRDDASLPYHMRWVWDGRPFENRHVLVRCYHGLGDTLQFARYLPRLASMTASLTVETQPQLIPLLRGLANNIQFIPFRPEAPAPPAECDIEIMELAFALRAPPDAVTAPYL